MSLSFVRGREIRRALLVAGLAGACAAASAMPAGAQTSCPPGSGGGPYCQLIPTQLVAPAVILGGVSATLTRTDTGAPLPGQTLTFTAGGTLLCVATTDANGNASCTSLTALLTAILNLGFHVSYAGTSVYAPASATGNLIQIGTLIVGAGGVTTSFDKRGTLTAHQRAKLKAELRHIGRRRLLHDLRRLRREHLI